jgi:DNA (cytosine-5)-methyltransferase 1
MTDVLTKEQRSFNMSQIRSENTDPEIKFKSLLSSHRIGNFRMHPKEITGKPDFYFPASKIVVFIDGCFWHGCKKCFQKPQINKKFWLNKINNNLKRDQKINEVLNRQHYKVIRFWEHEIKRRPEKCFTLLERELRKRNVKTKSLPTVLDLFSGTGGLSEGFWKAGFNFIAYVEIDKDSCETLKTRTLYYLLLEKKKIDEYYKYLNGTKTKEDLLLEYDEKKKVQDSVINEEISERTLPKIKRIIKRIMRKKKIKNVDVIIGGPPCQTYSAVGRARIGTDVKNDKRNDLYKLYLEFIREFKPRIFIFENVLGMKTVENGKYLKDLKTKVKKLGYFIKDYYLNLSNFGVPQTRKRIILVGINNKKVENIIFPKFKQVNSSVTVNNFLTDLPDIKAGDQEVIMNYKKTPSPFLVKSGIRKKGFNILTDHIVRKHCDRDLKIYKMAINYLKANRRLKYNDLPIGLKTHKNITSFLDRYRVVDQNAYIVQTVTAHIAKDGHYYIHPDIKQLRSISVREAARLQTFPDDYKFEGSMTSKFKQIGNAVPPLLSQMIANKILKII